MLMLRRWFGFAKPAAPELRPLTREEHRWIRTTFPGAWSLQTFDPVVFGCEPEWNFWAYAGEHRLSFSADEVGLRVSVAIGYRQPGPPVCHLDFPLTDISEQAAFLAWLQGAA